MLRVTRDFNVTFGYRHYVYSAAIRETLIKSDNDLISISIRWALLHFFYPLPMEGGCPKGRGLAKVERERSREIFLAHRISQLVFLSVGSILLVSRHQTPSVFLSARGIPRLRSGWRCGEAASAFPWSLTTSPQSLFSPLFYQMSRQWFEWIIKIF